MKLTELLAWQESFSPSAYLLACSGGRDSIALLAALGAMKSELSAPVVVAYVNHGWHADAEKWGELVERTCAKYEFDFELIKLSDLSKSNAEAVARKARYQALAELLPERGVLLTAHHQEDQAETLLLNLLRGSSLDGLSAMPERLVFAGGEHWRPLLNTPRHEIEAYIALEQLDYVDDSSNADTRYTRNWLRHEVLSVMQTRFPDAAKRIARSAKQLGEERTFRDEILDGCLPDVVTDTLPLSCLLERPAYQQASLVRRWLQRLKIATPPRIQLQEWLRQINTDAHQAQIVFSDYMLLKYADTLYCLSTQIPESAPDFQMKTVWQGVGTLQVEDKQGRLSDKHCYWTLYQPKARFRPQGKAHHKMLKEWFRLARIPPFLRQRTPMLWVDDDLVWVGDIGTAKSYGDISVLWHKSHGSGSMNS